jgi:hypothetical protein
VHRPLLWAVLLAALVATALAVLFVSRAFPPPDSTAAALGVGWLGGPYLLAVVLAVVLRRHPTALWVLLATVVLAGAVGAVLCAEVADAVVTARREAEAAVLPGEDPSRGAAGKRKAGADLGSFVADVFGVAVLVVIPPVQALAVASAAGVGYALSVWRRGRAEDRRVWLAEHTDDRESG